MSPRTADPEVAEALIEAGARLVAAHELLTARRLATEIGASTSAVYTHFGSMDELRRAIRRTGFERLAEYLTSYEHTDDPVADLIKQGWAYRANALANPTMYRVMFMEAPLDEADAEVGFYTFEMVIAAVQRCIDAKRFDEREAFDMALELWAASHGACTLYLAALLETDTLDRLTTSMGRALFLSFGDDEKELLASLKRATRWIKTQQSVSEAG